MAISDESLKEQLPYYLTKDQKEGLLRALKDFPENTNYYLYGSQDELLQGDGWTKLQLRSFETGEKASILGIVLSNTCDLSPENKRDFPTQITFSPLVPLAGYIHALKQAGIKDDKIHNKVKTIKEQKVTSIFFLPAAGSDLAEDCVALLDQLYTMPTESFELEKEKTKTFTLSLTGFYLFLFKLSVHFCRFQENVPRS